jgi:hypothetical protein
VMQFTPRRMQFVANRCPGRDRLDKVSSFQPYRGT